MHAPPGHQGVLRAMQARQPNPPRTPARSYICRSNPRQLSHPQSFRAPVCATRGERKGGAVVRRSMATSALAAAVALLAVAAGGAAAQGVGSVITQAVFESMLPNRDNPACPAKGFYTYDAFIAAANSFPAFGTTGGDELAKRELAAFFGQTSHETTGGTKGNADQFQWGYCFKEENNKATSPPYYGRGPIQLTGQSNYQQAGDALDVDLVSNPDLVATDPVVSFKTAMWFWTTAQSPKPSCHDVILGNWTPTAADSAAGRAPGYGVITNIINGGIECGVGMNDNGGNADRIGYYKRYCDMLGVGYGDNLDCYSQQKFG